jgi:hypothetical protein
MRKTMWRIALAAALALAGCDQGTSGGTTDNGAADNTTVADVVETATADATGPDGTIDEDATVVADTTAAEATTDMAIEAEAAEALISVIHGAETKVVDVAKMATVDVDGTPVVLLSEVVKAAFPAIVLTEVTVDFTGAEGYKPGSKSNCAGVVPIPGKSLEQGWIDPATTNLLWDESLGYPGCLHVKLTTEIILADI